MQICKYKSYRLRFPSPDKVGPYSMIQINRVYYVFFADHKVADTI